MKKTVVITGASGAIGSACVKKFFSEGYNVVAGYLKNESAIAQMEKEYGGERFFAVCADVSERDGAKVLADAAIKRFGKIDVLVNNAGISLVKLFQDTTEEEFQNIMAVNANSAFYMSQFAVCDMLKYHSGSIVNISSIWGEEGASAEVAYSMSKAAVIGFTKALAKEVGPSGIRVNCVSPGLIDSKMNSCFSKEDLEAFAQDTPLYRMGKADEVSEAVYFLASEKSSFITGRVLGVSGGIVV